MPPNPLAERTLETRVTLEAITGFWEIVKDGQDADNATYFLDIRADGKCKTNYGARFTEQRIDGFDTVEVLTDSAFALAISQGESYVFAVTRFDGDQMTVLVDGWKEQPLTLTRKPHPSGLKLAEPGKAGDRDNGGCQRLGLPVPAALIGQEPGCRAVAAGVHCHRIVRHGRPGCPAAGIFEGAGASGVVALAGWYNAASGRARPAG